MPLPLALALATVIHCGFNTGAALGGLLSQQLLGTFGWRSVLITGGVLPLIFALILIRYLPESMQYLVQAPENKRRLTHLLNTFVPGIADEKRIFIPLSRKKHMPVPQDRFCIRRTPLAPSRCG
jgi:MFS family permease